MRKRFLILLFRKESSGPAAYTLLRPSPLFYSALSGEMRSACASAPPQAELHMIPVYPDKKSTIIFFLSSFKKFSGFPVRFPVSII